MSKSTRARARERKKEREKERNRNRQYIIIGAIVAVVVVVIGFFALSNLPSEAPLPDTLDRYSDIEQSVTSEGFPVLGDPRAPVEVKEYASFTCPHCAEFHEFSFPELLERVKSGEISFVYIPREVGSVPNPGGANRAAMCAGEQGKFWEMQDVLFHWHKVLGNAAFQGNRLTAGAQALGLNMADFDSCFNSSRIGNLLNLAAAESITGTPTFKVNDAVVESATLEAINAAIESILDITVDEPDEVDTPVVEEEPTAVEAEATDVESEDEADTVEATEATTPDDEATAEAED